MFSTNQNVYIYIYIMSKQYQQQISTYDMFAQTAGFDFSGADITRVCNEWEDTPHGRLFCCDDFGAESRLVPLESWIFWSQVNCNVKSRELPLPSTVLTHYVWSQNEIPVLVIIMGCTSLFWLNRDCFPKLSLTTPCNQRSEYQPQLTVAHQYFMGWGSGIFDG